MMIHYSMDIDLYEAIDICNETSSRMELRLTKCRTDCSDKLKRKLGTALALVTNHLNGTVKT